MTSPRGFIARRPLLAYFILTFGLTWLAWLPFVLSTSGLGILPWHPPRLFGSTQLLGVLPGAYLGPVTSALVVTALAAGRPGLTRWVRRLVRWRVSLRWYALVLLGVPAAAIAATFALPRAWAGAHLPSPTILLLYLPILALQVLTTGVAEEPGWRDFAQPRLQIRFGPLRASLILGPLWGAWHLPLFFTEWAGWPHVDWVMPVEFLAGSTVLSIVLTWVFNRTGESLPLVMLLHAGVNTVFSLVWPQIFPQLDLFRDSLHALTISAGLAAAVLMVATRGRLGMPRDGAPVRPASEGPASTKRKPHVPRHAQLR
ncbi:type II CAAX endopeptidase family protein [Paractinoplanes ferrugineus]|uniref:CAAX amino protease n=1 Tax=Paractinoplanes ferrugineus TaxID=113564 RepID=A0A919MCR3_9ACTN|nr:type II CAAX endopeptidase family protein [Actinoplanes ferrugineus]GIE15001.1 CAAX amino protease [Actinoplanes ferrugineus]